MTRPTGSTNFTNVHRNAHLGENLKIHEYVWIGEEVIIGANCSIQAFVFIPNGVRIGDNVFIGPRVTFLNDKHPPSDEWLETIVQDGVSIGGAATILPGVVLGRGCVIGAGSVVTKDVWPNTTVVGNPAKVMDL